MTSAKGQLPTKLEEENSKF